MQASGLALLLLVLALRLMVPPGWMPAGNSGFSIAPCGGLAAAAPSRGHHGHGEAPAPAPATADHACAFSGLGAPMAPPPDVAVDLLPTADLASTLIVRTVDMAVRRGLAAPPPPSTGPPA